MRFPTLFVIRVYNLRKINCIFTFHQNAPVCLPTKSALIPHASLEGTVRHGFVPREAVNTLFSLVASLSIWHRYL